MQYHEKIAVPIYYVCMWICICVYRDKSSTCSSCKRNSMHAHALRHGHNNASGKGHQRMPHVNCSPHLLHGLGMYSKLISETEQVRRDLGNTNKAGDVYEVIRLDTAGENVKCSCHLLNLAKLKSSHN